MAFLMLFPHTATILQITNPSNDAKRDTLITIHLFSDGLDSSQYA